MNLKDFKFEKRLGQNFITDTNLLSAIISDSGISKADNVLEIGMGAGALTKLLAENCENVFGFEIDRRLEEILNEQLKDCKNVHLFFEDFLKVDMKDFEEEIACDYKVVANLPYYITTPILFKLLEECNRVLSITIMVQQEVGERICAKPSSKDYSALTVAINLLGSAKILRKVSRKLFTPEPNVDSIVVKIDIEREKLREFQNQKLRKIVKAAFAMRRKTLLNNLTAIGYSKEKLISAFEKLNFDLKIRGEALTSNDFINLEKEI